MRTRRVGLAHHRCPAALAIAIAISASAQEPLKVICASRADRPPVIDGILGDACWQKTEARSDFTPPDSDVPVKRTTTMRLVYDDQNLYMGLAFSWDDVETLRRGVAEILEKRGQPTGRINSIKAYSNRYGVELFIDPGATQINYYQILFNAAGQYTGNYKMIWDAFEGGHTVKSAVVGNGPSSAPGPRPSSWCAEFVYPAKGLRPGDEWGLNLCRNDETYYAIWRRVGGAYHEPKKFGRLVIGSYREWWRSVWTTGTQMQLAEIATVIERHGGEHSHLRRLHECVRQKATEVQRVAAEHPPQTRESFERLYNAFVRFRTDFTRLASSCRTLEAMAKAK